VLRAAKKAIFHLTAKNNIIAGSNKLIADELNWFVSDVENTVVWKHPSTAQQLEL